MPRKPRGKANGKPPFHPTEEDRKTVSLMCAVGIPHEGIALCIQDGIDDKTLRKYFHEELKTAKIKANAKVGGSIFNAAMSGNMTAASLWAKTQMGWKETQQINTNVSVNKIERIIVDPTDSDTQSV